MIENIKHYSKVALDIILFAYNFLVAQLIKADDRQRRIAQEKNDFGENVGILGKIKDIIGMVGYYVGPRKFTLSEQKDLVETLRMAVKFGNSVTQPFEFFMNRRDLRLFVRRRCKDVFQELSYTSLHEALAGKKILHDEYVTLIEVASRTGDYIPTYTSIIESITDKQKRKTVFIILMIQPFLTLITAIGIEIYIAMSIVPELTMHIPEEEAPPTLASYIALRDILMNKKMEYFIKISIISVGLFFFFKLQATRYLVHFTMMQIPLVNKLIAQWEISKFFDSINAMIKSGASMQEATTTAVGLINNLVIRTSLLQDLRNLGTKTNDLSLILGSAVYINLKVRNQLRIASKSGSDSSDILESVVEEYKDSMKKLLEAPANLIIPVMLLGGTLYLSVRLLPLFNEINAFLENIGG